MALKTAEVDTRAFKKSMELLALAWSPKVLAQKSTQLALVILADSQNAPVPRDTGALAESGSVQPGEREGEVVFGFNRAYASAQDFGTTKLPPKFYGSDLGPNFYFSETVRRAGPKVLPTMATLMRADLARIDRRIKTLERRRRLK